MRLLKLFNGVPGRVIKDTAFVCVAAVLVTLYQGWPGWAIVIAAVGPWFLPLAYQTRWLTRHYGWFAFFYVLVVFQIGHYLEHVSQFVQNHFLGQGLAASGTISVLNIAWVHFGWNTYVFLASMLLVLKFRRNPWLWALFVAAIGHEIEHIYTIVKYVETGNMSFGLLGLGGRYDWPRWITGQDLHHVYNTIETIPLIAGFFYQLRRTHDLEAEDQASGTPAIPDTISAAAADAT